MKKCRLAHSLLALALGLSGALPGLGEKPSPTPTSQPKVKKKLGGGAFGQPPATTPTPGPLGGGSLADVVRKTQDSAPPPSQGRGRGIVITNESLLKPEKPGESPAGTLTIIGSAKAKPTVKGRPTPTAPAVTIPEYRDSSGRSEADWRARAKATRERVGRAETEVGTAEAEARRLENDFYAWSDSNYRERVIRPAWDQAKEKLALAQAEVEKAREEMSTLEDEARKSGAPPGWLR